MAARVGHPSYIPEYPGISRIKTFRNTTPKAVCREVEAHHPEQKKPQTLATRTEFWWSERQPDAPSLWDSTIELGADLFQEISTR